MNTSMGLKTTKSLEFNLREFSGSLGDLGTLLPLAVGYISACGLPPAGFLVMMGLANIATGLIYRLPIPIEPMKVIAVVAIAQHWTPSMIYASGFSMGVIWIIFAATGLVHWIAKVTPLSVIRGIQAALGVLLAIEASKWLSSDWILGVIAILIVLVLRNSRYTPAALVLIALGIAIMIGSRSMRDIAPMGFSAPPFTGFTMKEAWDTLLLAGFAQIPLTITNATISTAALISTYWPDKPVTTKKLSWNQGIMNVVVSFFGGMPMCHGAGGLAGQYYFGARTGGTNIIEGVIEISLGLFLSASIVGLFSAFPRPIIGSMMLLVGIELTKFAKEIRIGKDLLPLSLTVLISILTNMAYGFLAGLACHYALGMIRKDG